MLSFFSFNNYDKYLIQLQDVASNPFVLKYTINPSTSPNMIGPSSRRDIMHVLSKFPGLQRNFGAHIHFFI